MITLKEGRPLTACVVIAAFAASASWNLYGAANMFYGLFATVIFVVMIASAELLAGLVLRHIVEDFNNNNELKGILGSMIFMLCIFGCVTAGHRAFDVQAIQQRETNTFNEAKADRHTAQSVILFAKAKAASATGDRDTEVAQTRLANTELENAHKLKLEIERKKPMSEFTMWSIILLFEMIKLGGRWALAVQSKPRWNWRRRQIQALKDKQALREAREKYKVA